MNDGTQCCAPVSVHHLACDGRSVPGAPFPLCVGHLAEVLKFVNDAQARAVGSPTPTAGDLPPTVGTVYYVSTGPFIKIGFTTNLAQRLKQYPPDAEVLTTEPGTAALEKQRHRQFADDLTAREEWFTPSPALMEHIAQIQAWTPKQRAEAQGPMHPGGVARVAARRAQFAFDQR